MNPRDEAEVQRCVRRAEYTAWGPDNFIVEIKGWSSSRAVQILVRHLFRYGLRNMPKGLLQMIPFNLSLLLYDMFVESLLIMNSGKCDYEKIHAKLKD